MRVGFGVLGPVAAWDADGHAIALKGPRHRAVLARLIVARRRVVPVSRLVDDLWTEPPPGAVGAVRTFVAALRRALEPQRPPRAPARLLVTEGPGYALRADVDAVDAWCFEQDVAAAATLPPDGALPRLEAALSRWRGPAYADFADEDWARGERSRLAELRLHAVERQAEARLALGRAAEAVPDLEAHLAEHPWREGAWRALAVALYRTGRQGDALAVLRRARTLLVEQLGVDPGPELRRLETDILDQAPHLDPATARGGAAAQLWAEAAAAYDRTVASGARTRLESTVGLLRDLSMTGGGGLPTARQQRVAAVAAAEELGDPELTARVIGSYDVPAIWTRLDDPEQAASIVAAAERTLAALAAGPGVPGEGVPGAEPPDHGGPGHGEPAHETPGREAPDHGATDHAAGARKGISQEPSGHETRAHRAPGHGASSHGTTGQGAPAHEATGHDAPGHEAPGRAVTGHEGPWHETLGSEVPSHGAAAHEGPDREAPDHGATGRDTPGHGTPDHGTPDHGTPERAVTGRELPSRWASGYEAVEPGPTGEAAPRHEAVRARLLATIAVESRGGRSERGRQAARQAEEIARRLDDPALLAFALNGVFMQTFDRAGLAPRRDATGAELIALSERHGLVTFEVLGHLIRLQARSALADFASADRHAAAADRLGERHERPLVGVFTEWYRALRLAATGQAAEAEAAYRDAATRLDDAGMPGLAHGLLPLTLLCLRVEQGRPAPTDPDLDWGPYAPWARPLVLLARDHRTEAAAALRTVPEPPRDLLLEALWCLTGRAAIAVGDRQTMARARTALAPAAAELAGAGSGLLTLGPVARHLADLTDALGRGG
ncbi:BTAD domain-containing putative transcriptional regulator [Streptomyces sp. PSAA01]|uniref:BTAD domain-containing putative transcriptional regulator n=1 Tax=Streptomyces sp. PSAA01 TaxID=2912762 RepID=UPI001F01EC82|nr:BTAD domain-containing putative transcriptional regulator [Streptomyces sp. PSAA01]MCG0289428.1 winged helix-turn-helix domain-containing protein [Streptomyces sp. PSAA01]